MPDSSRLLLRARVKCPDEAERRLQERLFQATAVAMQLTRNSCYAILV
jgi:hypothetical protein